MLGVHFEDSRWRVGPHGHDSRHEDHRSHRRRRQQPGCVETCADTQSSVSAAAEEWVPRSRLNDEMMVFLSLIFFQGGFSWERLMYDGLNGFYLSRANYNFPPFLSPELWQHDTLSAVDGVWADKCARLDSGPVEALNIVQKVIRMEIQQPICPGSTIKLPGFC